MNGSLPMSTSIVSQEVKVRMGESGLAARPPRTVFDNFVETCAKYGDQPALYQKQPRSDGTYDGDWTMWTWNEYRAQVDAFGKSLVALGCKKFDVINIIGFNSPEWFIANFGAMAGGCVSAGIYSTNGPEACKYITQHSKAVVVIVHGLDQLQKYQAISHELPFLKAIVVYGPETAPAVDQSNGMPIYSMEHFLRLGTAVSDSHLMERIGSWKPGETCTLIYTSGTTGPPKAVMITHDNITWTTAAMLQSTRKGYMDANDCTISYLPLSHIAAQMLDLHMPMASGAQVYFARQDALKGSLVETLTEVRPTMFFGVPRVWEKIYDKLQAVARESSGIQKGLSSWAKSQAASYWEVQSFEWSNHFSFMRTFPITYYLAKVLLKVAHKRLGLDRCYGFYTAAAPIEAKILKYFASIDIPIMEIFGQSECTGPSTVNRYDAFKFGSVGRPLKGTEIRISSGTGELANRGRNVFAGYMGMPDKTAETIDAYGWLLSGDIAAVDDCHDPEIPKPSGFVQITGRIKELIITAGGENVPPVLIEDQLKTAIPALSNTVVIGDKRKFLTAVFCVTVAFDAEGNATNKLDGVALETSLALGSKATTTDDVQSDAKWKAHLDDGVNRANSQAASRAQKVRKWALLPTDFTEKGGELTPTLKLKRSVVVEKYSDVIEGMYA